ncbi:uncharacterized protein LOC126797169 [Argentina anserina]|uniref:uncharacterized protein LOC126797169 n=1 Tax=Argentina anserina TaxID=57926 RepID=UPI0021767769|nr:uncharacterized protein LOC126797169 [Potentilla anserina]
MIAQVDQEMNFESRDIDKGITIEDSGRDIDERRTIKDNRRVSTPDDRALVPRPCTLTSSENQFVILAQEAIVGAANELIEQLEDYVFQGPNAQTLDEENSMVVTNEALDDVEGSFPTPSTRTEDNATVVRELEDGAHEKRGGILPNAVSCSDFQYMSTNYELVHLPTKGLPYTWMNRRGVGASVEMRLDQCLSNFSWMDEVWQSSHFYGNSIFVLASKLRTLKHQIRVWNKVEFGDVNVMVEKSFDDLHIIQREIASLGPSDDLLSRKSVASTQSLSIMRDGNSIIDDLKEISDHVVNCFNGLFTTYSFVRDTGLVSQCWSLVGVEVVQAVHSFFNTGYILPHFNSNLIILIPKVPGAGTVTQLRPIAISNFIFKLITKILADSLGSIATRIISPNQSAFLRGRTIIDPIILTSECINLLDCNCKGGNNAIKFDVQKAFDTLDWGFLLRVLKAFGFSDHFCDLIKAILGSAHLSILVNGEMEWFFPCSRGVRQGDHLSHILFCLAEEILSRGLTKLAEDGLIDLLSSHLGITPPSHVLFADDIIVFMRGTKRSLKNLIKFMEEYGLNSGQRVNKSKSLVFFAKYAHRRRFVIRKI